MIVERGPLTTVLPLRVLCGVIDVAATPKQHQPCAEQARQQGSHSHAVHVCPVECRAVLVQGPDQVSRGYGLSRHCRDPLRLQLTQSAWAGSRSGVPCLQWRILSGSWSLALSFLFFGIVDRRASCRSAQNLRHGAVQSKGGKSQILAGCEDSDRFTRPVWLTVCRN